MGEIVNALDGYLVEHGLNVRFRGYGRSLYGHQEMNPDERIRRLALFEGAKAGDPEAAAALLREYRCKVVV